MLGERLARRLGTLWLSWASKVRTTIITTIALTWISLMQCLARYRLISWKKRYSMKVSASTREKSNWSRTSIGIEHGKSPFHSVWVKRSGSLTKWGRTLTSTLKSFNWGSASTTLMRNSYLSCVQEAQMITSLAIDHEIDVPIVFKSRTQLPVSIVATPT